MNTVNPEPLDLDAIQADLADVDIALQRLEDGTYWTCEITGAPIDDSVLAEKPTARRA
jgi:RNA polymerase-binding transcription factor DksA